jgi:hypothetical protein
VTRLEEQVPTTTGELELCVLALGLSPATLAFATDMLETLRVDALEDGEGNELRPDPDVRWMGTPNVAGGLWRDVFHFELRGLLRGVREISRLEGTLHLRLPASVEEIRLDPLAAGESTHGDWRVRVVSTGTSPQIELSGPGASRAGLALRFAPRDRNGAPLAMDYSSADAFGSKVHASLQTREPAASLALKIVRTALVEYPLELGPVPLRRYADQPEELEELAFEGELPLAVEFVRFTDRSDADFPKLELRVVNRSNKTVAEARVQLEYLDAEGAALKEFPHSLTGTFDSDGEKPLADARASATQELVAFFMPPETRSVRARLEEVVFADGTRWTPPGE